MDFSGDNTRQVICKCICHKYGLNVMHIRPCCNLTYKKYINSDGTVNMNDYNALLSEYNRQKKE